MLHGGRACNSVESLGSQQNGTHAVKHMYKKDWYNNINIHNVQLHAMVVLSFAFIYIYIYGIKM